MKVNNERIISIKDFVPALAGVIGKISLAGAFAVSWSLSLNITNPSFVAENVRLELFVAGIITIIFALAFKLLAAPPGTLAPLIPMIPIMALAGVHPLAFGLLLGVIGILLSGFKAFSKIVNISGKATKGGLILLFGILGIYGALQSLSLFAKITVGILPVVILLAINLLVYITLNKFKIGWLVIPSCVAIGVIFSLLLKIYPQITTSVGLPIVNPIYWWNELWGVGFIFGPFEIIRALPYALFAMVLWPLDALAIKTIQDENYTKEQEKYKFDMDNTYLVVGIRNIIGVILGGAQSAAIWRSFMIPLSIIRRPMRFASLALGIMCIGAALIGAPIDIAIFPPLLWPVLIYGVFLPMAVSGIRIIIFNKSYKISGVCVLAGLIFNPIVGFLISTVIERILPLIIKKKVSVKPD